MHPRLPKNWPRRLFVMACSTTLMVTSLLWVDSYVENPSKLTNNGIIDSLSPGFFSLFPQALAGRRAIIPKAPAGRRLGWFPGASAERFLELETDRGVFKVGYYQAVPMETPQYSLKRSLWTFQFDAHVAVHAWTYEFAEGYQLRNMTRVWAVEFPIGVITLLTLIPAGRASWIGLRSRRRRRRRQCIRCGYDLTGNVTGRCSECGNDIVDQQSATVSNAASDALHDV